MKDFDETFALAILLYLPVVFKSIQYNRNQLNNRGLKNHQLVWSVRACNFDNCIREFLEHNGEAVVVNVGSGMDTTFLRIDNVNVHWINIDLPDIEVLRQKLIPDTARLRIDKMVYIQP